MAIFMSMRMKGSFFWLFSTLLLFPVLTFSRPHLPRMVGGDTTFVLDPESSQAFYGELSEGRHVFIINSDRSFRLYVSLMLPDLVGVNKNLSAQIAPVVEQAQTSLWPVYLEGTSAKWTHFYEAFVGDDYLIGPGFETRESSLEHPEGRIVPAGSYVVIVTILHGQGKYVLGIGDAEKWSMKETLNAILLLPELKVFFHKSPLLSFSTPYTIGILLILVLFVLVILRLIYRLFSRWVKET